jgi:hypothetical protein
MIKWVKSRDWNGNACNVSNEVQNVGTFLQYARDFHNDDRAGNAVECLLDLLEQTQDPVTGYWGYPADTPMNRSLGVQTGYHLWLLFFYDKRPIRYSERIIDNALLTRNSFDGFGVLLNSSACEDIDSIDPLVRLAIETDYRKQEIIDMLAAARLWIFANKNKDGGFVFRRCEPFMYGHERMSSQKDESAMFPTWFRTLSLAYISQLLPDNFNTTFEWQFVNCPGHQFWRKNTN